MHLGHLHGPPMAAAQERDTRCIMRSQHLAKLLLLFGCKRGGGAMPLLMCNKGADILKQRSTGQGTVKAGWIPGWLHQATSPPSVSGHCTLSILRNILTRAQGGCQSQLLLAARALTVTPSGLLNTSSFAGNWATQGYCSLWQS